MAHQVTTPFDIAAAVLMCAATLETGQLVGYWPGPADPRWPHLIIFVLLAIVTAVASRFLHR